MTTNQDPSSDYNEPGYYEDNPPVQQPQQYPPPPNQTAVTGWPIPYQRRKTNGLAVAGFVLGLLWLFWVGSILAIIFGHTARSQIKADPTQDGDALAITALVLGYIGAATFAIFIVLPLLALPWTA